MRIIVLNFFYQAHADHTLNKILAAKNFKSGHKLTKLQYFSPVPKSPNHTGVICVKKPALEYLVLGPL